MEVNRIGLSLVYCLMKIDPEYREIVRRLRMYGITPSGDKDSDKARLHNIELQEAEKENEISNKFLTLSKSEKEKILNKKIENLKDKHLENYLDTTKAMEILGQQKFLAIKMKYEKENT